MIGSFSGPATGAPWYTRFSFFNRKHSGVLAADQIPARMLGNMVNYGNSSYSYDRTTTPKFYGYSGTGYGSFNWPRPITFNMDSWSVPIYVVHSITQPSTIDRVQFTSITYNNGNVMQFLSAVPFPKATLLPRVADTPPVHYGDGWLWAAGNMGADSADGMLMIWDQDTDEMWEFAYPRRTDTNHWYAYGASYMSNTARFNGVNWWDSAAGTRGSKVGIMGGVITQQDIRDVQAGKAINHAIVFAVATNGYLNGKPVPPALRADGNVFNQQSTIPSGFPGQGGANPAYGKDAINEAQCFTLPKNVDLSGCTHPMGYAIAVAIRDYGFYNVDTAGLTTIWVEPRQTLGSIYHLQGPDAVDPFTLTWPGGSPFWPTDSIGGASGSVLNEIPWDKLQVLAPIMN